LKESLRKWRKIPGAFDQRADIIEKEWRVTKSTGNKIKIKTVTRHAHDSEMMR